MSSQTLRILANLSQYDYGVKNRGLSFEYDTFYRFFQQRGYDVCLFDPVHWYSQGGQKAVGRALRQIVASHNFDIIFTVPTSGELSFATLDALMHKQSGAISLAWMCDDKWRWESYGKFLAPHFDFVVTTDPNALQKYNHIGYDHALLSQWAHNPEVFRQLSLTKTRDVVFVGGASSWRRYVVAHLRRQGIHVACYGTGWDNGRLTCAQTVEVYNQAKIVLNISNSAQNNLGFLCWVKIPQWQGSFKRLFCDAFPGLTEFISTPKRCEDIKARFFEVTGCGSLLISYPVEHLDTYFHLEQDLVIYRSLNQLTERVSYYLAHEKEREKIAKHGHIRATKDHTYQQRFAEIFAQLGL